MIFILLPVVVSCSQISNIENADDVTSTEDFGMRMSDKIRDVKFNSEEINIWQTTTASNSAEYYYDMNGSMDEGSIIDSKLWERNALVEEYLNLQINFVDTGTLSKDAAEYIRPFLLSDTKQEYAC